MNEKIKKISQVSICLNVEKEKISEIALFHPLERESSFDERSKPISQRKWRYSSHVSFLKRLSIKAQQFMFKHAPALIGQERRSIEAKFKTVLAILLVQEAIRDFFLTSTERKENFLQAVERAAHAFGFHSFSPPIETSPLLISRELTKLPKKETSLVEDPMELNLQMAALDRLERDQILFSILNHVQRPPITSTLEITTEQEIESISVTTTYAKYKITESDPSTGSSVYQFSENQATSSIRTLDNITPGAKGAMNQRKSTDANTNELIGAYCGELNSMHHVLEQILFLLDQKKGQTVLMDTPPSRVPVQEIKILFTSLLSWNELDLIKEERLAIHALDQKILVTDDGRLLRLSLLYYNIPFNALNKYPTPAELEASIKDINEENLIILAFEALKKLGLSSETLQGSVSRLEELRSRHDEAFFFEKQRLILEEIDRFQLVKKWLIEQVEKREEVLAACLLALLTQKKPDGKPLKGIDCLLVLDYLARELGYLHNKNCCNSTDRSAGADAADKAQHAFKHILQYPFFPGSTSDMEISLFKVLYSMYLVWEEPEINAALSTGFMGEKFYNNIFQKNPETTRYLTPWLQKHPDMYLALSGHRY